jgi:trimeric autotransporter adhesin
VFDNTETNISIVTAEAGSGADNVAALYVSDSNSSRTSDLIVNSALNIDVDASKGSSGYKELIWVQGSNLTIYGNLTGTVAASGEGDLRGIRVTYNNGHVGYLVLNGTNTVSVTSTVNEDYSTDYAMRGLLVESSSVTGSGSLSITLTDENGYMPIVQGVSMNSNISDSEVDLSGSLTVSVNSGASSEDAKGIYLNAVNNAQNQTSMTIGSALDVTLSTSGTDETASAVYLQGYLQGENASLTANGVATLTANRTARTDAGSIYGVYASQSATAAFNAGLTDTVTMEDSDGGTAAGIYADASTVTVSSGTTSISVSDSGSSSTVIGIAAEDSSEISISGTSASVSAAGGASATALSASDSTVALTADAVTVSAETADGTLGTAVEAADESSVYVNSDTSGSATGGTLAMTGNISVDATSTALLNFDGSSSSLTGAAMLSSSSTGTTASTTSSGVLNLSFTDGAVWNVTGASTLSTLNAESSSVYVGTTSSYWTNTDPVTESFTPVSVTADSLTGDGSSFYLRAAIEENYADTLTFGTAEGAYTLYVKSSGTETATVESMDQYLVHVDDGDTTATFTLGNSAGVVDAGVYVYELASRTTSDGAVEWYLRRVESTDTDDTESTDESSSDGVLSGNSGSSLAPLSPEAETVLILQGGASQTLYYLANLSDLRKRLGDVREQGRAAGVWTSFAASQNNLSAYRTATLKSRLYRANLGIDAKVGDS